MCLPPSCDHEVKEQDLALTIDDESDGNVRRVQRLDAGTRADLEKGSEYEC